MTLLDIHGPAWATTPLTPRYERVIAIVPAYNEELVIAATIASLQAQTRRPDLIVVVPNNCSDATAQVADAAGAYVMPYPGHNPDKKAGAINYALAQLESHLCADPWNTAILVMDGDTTLSPEFVEAGLASLAANVGGAGGTFVGRPSTTMLGYLQRMEYFRYGQVAPRMAYRAFVLTGTGTLFSWQALLDVRAQRRNEGGLLPAGFGFYDTHSLTEDNELTLALQACGYRVLSPAGMLATTDVMDEVGKLIKQRERWYLGALRNLRQYGRQMPWHMRWVYWRQQTGLLLSALVTVVYVLAVTVSFTVFDGVRFEWYWLIPTVLLLVERVSSVWAMGWRARIYAALFLPEQAYTSLLTYIYVRAFIAFVRGQRGSWTAT